MTAPVKILVCTTCRAPADVEGPDAAGPRAGARLHAALMQAAEADATATAFEIVGVECLSVCKRPVTIGFSAAGKWTYVYGDFAAEGSAEAILAAARQYAVAPDGLIPWRERPEALKKGVVARLPPLATALTENAAEPESTR